MPVSALPLLAPVYFGDVSHSLFGCYLEPPSAWRKCAVIVCQPLGHEYINCHRALRQLAVRLSEAGFPVLRFDYFGCGDSSGDCKEGSVTQWLKDISTAIAEARRRTGLEQVCLVGLRLGASLAALAAIERRDVDSLVLWDTIVSGQGYREDLFSLHKEMLRFRPKPRGPESSNNLDILGFPMSLDLCREIEQIQLTPSSWIAAKNVLVIESRQEPSEGNRNDRLRPVEGSLNFQSVNSPKIWLPREDGGLLVPNQVLQSIVSWLCDTHS
ncbi:MAG TPA: alpha/beta hydrolase [Candidatus Saccharimonadales bacterium]|nr:alpha/beta hydrolase [Candidatus Saccharimonadales bacterium]